MEKTVRAGIMLIELAPLVYWEEWETLIVEKAWSLDVSVPAARYFAIGTSC